METKPNPIYKNSMNYGTIVGLALCIIVIIVSTLKIKSQTIPNLLSYAILITAIVIGTKNLRDNLEGGFISYGRALWSGTLITFFCAIITCFYMLLHFRFIDPSAIDQILQQQEQGMIDNGMPDEQIEMGMKYARKFTTPIWIAIFGLIMYTFMGFIFSLITSAFLKKEATPFEKTDSN